MLKAFCINPELPKNLAFNTSLYTEEPYYKDEGMYEGSFDDLLIGCARDCCVTKEIDEAQQKDIDEMKLDDYYRRFILPLHEVYFYNEQLTAIEQNGFAVNEAEREALIRKYILRDEELRHELFQLCGEYVNVASYPQLNKLLYQKLNIPARKGTGEEVLTSLLNGPVKNEAHRAILEKILEDRQVRKTISSYLLSPCDFDGRMRTSYYICLETGRSATQQQEPPIRPNIEYKDSETGTKKKQNRGMAFQTITKHGDIGADIRRMLVPDEGCVFLQADSAQAEARVIFLLAEDYQALEDIDIHDYHALTASWFFGGVEDDYSKKVLGYESPTRFVGKTLRHAGHLGASKRRASISVNTDARKYKINYKISEAEAERALKIFHAKQPNIRGVFHAGIIECLGRNRQLIAPVPYGIDASTGGTRIFFERWGDELFRQAFSYLPQRIVSENTKGAALRIRRSNDWIRIIVEAHDSLLVQIKECNAEKAARILKQEFEVPIDFKGCSLSRGKLVIPCEVEIGKNYKDLSKFKFLGVD
jgi:DNA polymerase I-like protein with 3'-5' exonuclease and polymerase domains